MVIAKNPKRHTTATAEEKAEAFINEAGKAPTQADAKPMKRENKKPVPIRIDPPLLARIDLAAKRLGISRSAYIVSSAAERLERDGI